MTTAAGVGLGLLHWDGLGSAAELNQMRPSFLMDTKAHGLN